MLALPGCYASCNAFWRHRMKTTRHFAIANIFFCNVYDQWFAEILVSFYCINPGPAPRGAFRGRAPPIDCLCPPKQKLCPPSEDCAPKKLTDSGLLECKSRPKTPKLVVTALEFVSKNCFFVIFVNLHRISFKFWDENLFFFVLASEFVETRKNFETTTRICGNFETKTLFFDFSCPRASIEFTQINFSCPPPTQSRYPGVGPM